LEWAPAVTHTHHARLDTARCAKALTDEDIKIGASDFEDSDSEPEESECDLEESDLEEAEAEESEHETSGLEEPDLEESEPGSEIQDLIRAEQEKFEK